MDKHDLDNIGYAILICFSISVPLIIILYCAYKTLY